jgi:hypothetical protein
MARIARAGQASAYGLQIPTVGSISAWNRTGGSVVDGQLVMLDLALSSTEAVSFTFGAADSGWANFVDPTSAGASTTRYIFGLVDQSGGISDDQSGNILIQGIKSNALVIRDSGSISIGDLLIADTTNMSLEGMASPTSGYIYLARAQQAVTTPTSNTSAAVAFFGFGMPFGVAA